LHFVDSQKHLNMLFTLLQTDIAEAVPVQQEMSYSLLEIAAKGGWLMWVLLALSIIAIYIFGKKWWIIRQAGKIDKDFMMDIRDYIHEGKIKSARTLCSKYDAPVARMVEAGIARIGRPATDVQAARLVAAYTLVRIQREPQFQTLLRNARAEYATLRGRTAIEPAPAPDAILTRVGQTVSLQFTDRPVKGRLNLYAVDGRLVRTADVDGNTTISLANLPHGAYLVTFAGHELFRNLKIVY